MNRSRIVTKLPVNSTASARQGWRLSTLGRHRVCHPYKYMYDRIYSMMKNPVRANTPNPAMTQPAPSPPSTAAGCWRTRARTRPGRSRQTPSPSRDWTASPSARSPSGPEVGKAICKYCSATRNATTGGARPRHRPVPGPGHRTGHAQAHAAGAARALMNGWFDFVGNPSAAGRLRHYRGKQRIPRPPRTATGRHPAIPRWRPRACAN